MTKPNARKAQAKPQASPQAEGQKAKLGRPSTYDPAYCEQVVQFGAEGMEIVEIAVELGVVRTTIYKWAEQHPEFGNALARARDAAEAFHTKRIRSQLGIPSKEGNTGPYLSYMARRFGKDWREPRSVEHSGPDGKPIEMTSPDLSGLSDDELEALDALNGALARKSSSTH